MATTNKLHFYKQTGTPSGASIGSLWFDSANNLIKLCTGTNTWVTYSSNIANVEFTTDNKLKFTYTNNKDPYVVDFDEFVKAIAANAADIAANAAAIEALKTQVGDGNVPEAIETAINALDSTQGTTTVDTGKHVAVQVVQTNGKLSGLTVTESDIASAKDLTAAQGDITSLKGLVGTQAVSAQISTAIDALDSTQGSTSVATGKHVAVQVTQANGKITGVTVNENNIANASELTSEINRAKEAEGDLSERITTLKNTVDSFGTPLRFLGVSADAPTKTSDGEAIKEGDFYINPDGEEFIYAKTGDNDTLEWQKVGDTTKESAAITDLTNRVGTLEDYVEGKKVSVQISDAINKLDSTQGTTTIDTGKHIAVQVVQTDGKITGVTVNENNIANASELTAAQGDITALKNLVGTQSVSTQISTAINGLDSTQGTDAVAEGKHVAVKVVQTNGKLTALTVAESDIASAKDLTNLTSRVSTLESDICWDTFN